MDQAPEQNTSETILDATQEQSIDLAWQKVLENFSDENSHRRFLILCQAMGKLSEAAKRYREIKDRDPEHADTADKQLEKVLAAAVAALSASRSEKLKPALNKMTVFAIGVFLMMLFFVVWGLRKIF